jgi:hypothetical protein
MLTKAAIFALTVMPLVWAQPPVGSGPVQRQTIDWKSLVPDLREVLKDEFPHEELAGLYVRNQADITGDGIPEALVDFGKGGAYTDYLTVVRFQDGRPVVAVFKQPDGKKGSSIFAEGSSVKNGITVKLHPESHAVFACEYSMKDDGHLEKCTGGAYLWNGRTATFEYDKRLSSRIGKDFCRELEKQLAAPRHLPRQPDAMGHP